LAKPKITEIIIPSDISQIQVVEAKAEKIAQQFGYSEDECDSLAIALTEIVANAINHGNNRNKQKKVYVKFIVNRKTFEIHVKDEGDGFNPNEIADPLKPENLLKDSGRGVFIVKALVDDVKYKFLKTGTKVILIKHHK
jgi:serine/threonine-protein kinase RsbW